MKCVPSGSAGWIGRAMRRVIPLSVRRPLGIAVYRVRRRIREAPEQLSEILGRVPILAVRNLAYGDRFYDRADPELAGLHEAMVDALIELRSPRSVVDVGCGTGLMLRRFAEQRVVVQGVEGSRTAIRRSQLGDRIVRANLEREVPDLGRFDLSLCIEVAEHLRPASAAGLVEGLVRLSDVVVFTAAPPGQRGVAHINLQTKDYWRKLFEHHGFSRSVLERELLEAIAAVPEPEYIHANLMVFERSRAIAS